METTTVQVPGFARALELVENERICPLCQGAGVNVHTTLERANGYMSVCPKCYGHGKQRTCKYCGEWTDLSVPHRCDGYRQAEREKGQQRTQALFEKAQHLTVEEAVAAGIEFCDWPGDDGDAMLNLGDIEWLADDFEFDHGQRPKFAWATTETRLGFDADSIVSRACEDLHEEAYANIGEDAIKELQAFLDGWAERHGEGATSYFADETRAILVPPKQSDEETA